MTHIVPQNLLGDPAGDWIRSQVFARRSATAAPVADALSPIEAQALLRHMPQMPVVQSGTGISVAYNALGPVVSSTVTGGDIGEAMAMLPRPIWAGRAQSSAEILVAYDGLGPSFSLATTQSAAHTWTAQQTISNTLLVDGGSITCDRTGDSTNAVIRTDVDSGFVGTFGWRVEGVNAFQLNKNASDNLQLVSYNTTTGALIGECWSVDRTSRVTNFTVASTFTDAAGTRTNLGLGGLAVKTTVATADIDNDAVTYAKMQDVSATSRILGRKSASSGNAEECTLSEILDFIGSAAEGDILRRGASGWARLAYPSDNTKYLDGSGSYSHPASTGGAGYATALDLDFTAESTQSLSTDTTYSIGGQTWTKVNSAADATAMAVTNGTGLVIQPVATSNYNGTTRTAPYIYLDMATLIPSWYMGLPIRITCYVSADNIAAVGHSVGFSLDNLSTSTNTTSVLTMRIANNSGRTLEYGGILTGTAITFVTAVNSLATTERVFMYDQPSGRFLGQAQAYGGTYSGGLPALSAMIPRGRAVGTNSTYNVANDMVTGLPMKLVLYAHRNGSGTALSVTIARLKVEYRVS